MKQDKRIFNFVYNPHSDEYEFWCNQNLLVTLSGNYVASKKFENEGFGECFKRLCGEYFWDIACNNPQFSTRSLITHVFANKYQTDID